MRISDWSSDVCSSDLALRDEAADREAEHIDLIEVQRLDEGRAAVGHAIDGRRILARRTGDAGIIEQDHGAALGQAIGDEGIPVIEPAAKMLEEKKRRPALGAESGRATCRERVGQYV